jgi:hypothetical protein
MLFDPKLDSLGIEPRGLQEFLLTHGHDEAPSRGLNSLPLAQVERKASRSGSGPFGSTTFNFTSSSPLPPPRRGAPLPLRRRVVPVLDPLGTDTMTSPAGVGTRIWPPNTASVSEIGTSNEVLSPSAAHISGPAFYPCGAEFQKSRGSLCSSSES